MSLRQKPKFFKNRFLGFLGLNIGPTHSRTRYTGHRNAIKKKAYTRRLTNALLCLTLRNNSRP